MPYVAAAFVLFGMFWGSWNVVAADIERELGLSHTGFGALISVALAGAAVMNVIGGAWTERIGTGRALSRSLTIWSALVLALALVRGRVGVAIVVILLVAAGGVVDVVMNVAATAALSDRPGALVRFHAWFNAAAAIGAAASGVLLANAISFRMTWFVVAVGGAVLAFGCRNARLPASDEGEHVPFTSAVRTLHREGLLLVAAAFAVGAIVENAVELWGVLFLRTTMERGLLVGASGAVAGYAIAAVARVTLGPRVGRRSASRGTAIGAVTAAAGIVVLVAAPHPWLAAAGLVMAAAGASMCWPLLLAHATTGRDRPGPIVGGLTSLGYVGFVIGPAIVGSVAGFAGLRTGLVLLAAGAAFVALAAARPRVAARRA